MTEPLNLLGKDWFTEAEAAHYCCMSLSQFLLHAPGLGLHARAFMGRKVFSRAELFAVIDASPPWDSKRGGAAPPAAKPEIPEAEKPVAGQLLLSAKQAAQLAGYCISSMYRAMREGTFPLPRKRGGRSLWVASEVQAAIEKDIATLPRMVREQGARRLGRRPDLRSVPLRPYKPRK